MTLNCFFPSPWLLTDGTWLISSQLLGPKRYIEAKAECENIGQTLLTVKNEQKDTLVSQNLNAFQETKGQ